MNILFIINVNILMLIKWSYRFLQSCWPVDPKLASIFQGCSLTSFTDMSFWCTFLHPLTLNDSNIGVQTICYVGLGTSTLDWAPRWGMWYNKIVLCSHTILTFLGSYVITSSRERESLQWPHVFTSQLQFEDFKWQYVWLAIANQMTQNSISIEWSNLYVELEVVTNFKSYKLRGETPPILQCRNWNNMVFWLRIGA